MAGSIQLLEAAAMPCRRPAAGVDPGVAHLPLLAQLETIAEGGAERDRQRTPLIALKVT